MELVKQDLSTRVLTLYRSPSNTLSINIEIEIQYLRTLLTGLHTYFSINLSQGYFTMASIKANCRKVVCIGRNYA